MRRFLFLFVLLSFILFSCDDSDVRIIPEQEFPDNSKLVTGLEKHTVSNQLLSFSFSKANNPNSLLQNYTATLHSTDTINVFIPYLSDFKLIPTFNISEGAKVYALGAEQISDSTVIDFTKNVEFQVVDVDSNYVHTYILNVYNSGLPIVFIETPNGKDITSKTEWMDNASMRIYMKNGVSDYDSEEYGIQIRGRGNSTWSATTEKRPYAVKLNNKSEILGMAKHKRWVLLANYYDATFFRNTLANYLGHNYTNLDWTPSGESVELVLNGVHKGNYYLCEQSRMSKRRVPGEYLVEADRKEGSGQITGIKTGNFFNVKDVAADSVEDTDPVVVAHVKSILDRFETTLYGDDFLDADKGYKKLVDLESFVDWFLIKELSKDYDGNMYTSCYCHIMADSIIRMGPIWDFDLAFGGNPFEQLMGGGFGGFGFAGGTDYAWYNEPEGYHIADADWFVQMFKDPEFISLLRQKVDNMVAGLDDIMLYIDSSTDYLTLSASANKVGYSGTNAMSGFGGGFGWGWGNTSATTTTTQKKPYADEMQVIKAFVSERLKWMQSDLKSR